MACYCGVCATRIYSAPENGGPFRVSSSFDGWDEGKVSDTCEPCAAVLREATTAAARALVAQHRQDVDALRVQAAGWREEEALALKNRADFERAWRAEQERSRSRGGKP